MQDKTFSYQDERFADLQLLRYRVEGFETLSLRQQTLIWHLSEAALWGRDILWDQNCRYNLPLRRLLEHVYTHFTGNRGSEEFNAFEVYLKRTWFSNGIHHHYATDKFKPGFSRQFLVQLIDETNAQTSIAEWTEGGKEKGTDGKCKDSTNEKCNICLDTLLDVIFDESLMSKRVNQAQGEDLLLTSACNYYGEGVTQAEAEAFYNEQKAAASDPSRPVMYGMNSRLVKEGDGQLFELVWKEGGLYGNAISHIIEHLELALPFAESEQQADVIRTLIDFYRTGDLNTFDQYTIKWVQNTGDRVDFTNGFTEVYGDPLGLKASWEGYANFTDLDATQRTETLSRNAQWFEDHSPVDPRFKKKECRGVSAKVIVAAILGGDLYPSSAIGINLPNSNWVRQEYGSKSVTIGNLTSAYDKAAHGNGFREEFVIHDTDNATFNLLEKYADVCDDLHTDLHECLGHGSGQMLPGVDPDALKAYGSTIEEARADLFGLYYLADPKLVELGLTPNDDAHKAQYYSYLMNGLITQLVRIEPGNNIEESHMRNRSLIAHWVMANYPDAAQMVHQDGKTYVKVNDYATLRTAFGSLLAEVQRIKSEGDYDAAQQLVEQYGVKVDADLHQEVLQRYKALNLAPYKGFINPRYEVERDAQGNITRVTPHYDETFAQQMLRYGRDYSCSLGIRLR